jgi:hypothetical protein
MTWLAAAVGGSAALSAGGSIFTGLMGSNAAKSAAAGQESMGYQALGMQQSAIQQMLAYFDPFRQQGLQAGQALTGELYSPAQRTQQLQSSLTGFQNDLATAQRKLAEASSGSSVPVLTGKDASSRRVPIWNQAISQARSEVERIQGQITSTQGQLTAAQQNAANPASQADMITGNPMYQAGAQAVSRRLAAQGLQGSQEAIRQEGSLASGTYQNQIANQLALYQPTVGATAQMAGNIGTMGNQMAQTLGGIGQTNAQGILGASQALQGGITGAASSLNSGASNLLNYQLYNKVFGQANTGGTFMSGGDSMTQAQSLRKYAPPTSISGGM